MKAFFCFILVLATMFAVSAQANPHITFDHYYDFGDTAYVTPNEEVVLEFMSHIDSLVCPVNIYSFGYTISWDWTGEHSNYLPSYLLQSGYYREIRTENGVTVTWADSTHSQFGSGLWMGDLVFMNQFEPNTLRQVMVTMNAYYRDSTGAYDMVSGSKTIYVMCVNPLRGDVNHDGVVNLSDAQRLFELLNDGQFGWRQRYTLNDNPAFARVLWPWPTSLDVVFVDRYSRNPNDPSIAGLSLGEPMLQPQPGLTYAATTPWLLEGHLMVGTEGVAVAAFAVLPKGEQWYSSAEVRNGQADLGSLPQGIGLDQVIVFARTINGVTAIGSDNKSKPVPLSASLSQNYPNPFNPTTTIAFDLPRAGLVRLDVFNAEGQKVATLVNEQRSSGNQRVTFDGSSLSSGTYFYRLTSGDFVDAKKMVLMK
jgi:hypothetical protein